MELEGRNQLESKFAARFARLNSRLRHRLEDYLGHPPNAANVPESFWREVQDEANRELAIVLLLLWAQSAAQHGLAADLARDQALRYAQDRARQFAADYAKHTRDMLGKAAERWTPDAARLEVQRDLTTILGPGRAERVATTETTKAQTAGGEAGIGQTVGLDENDLWMTLDDSRVCPICAPLHQQPRSVWQAQFPSGPGDDVHPLCRCWISYARAPATV